MYGGYARLTVLANLAGALLLTAILPNQAGEPESVRPRLHSTIETLSQEYCLAPVQDSDNPRLGSLEVVLNLRVENRSGHPVILCKKCIEAGGEPTLSSVTPDGTPGEIRNGGMNVDRFGFDQPRKYPDRPRDGYAILTPGENLDLRYRAGILITYYPSTIPRMVFNSGNYFLGMSFRTWWAEKKDRSKALARKWRAYGELYTGLLTPEPLPIRIDVPEKLTVCPLERGIVDPD